MTKVNDMHIYGNHTNMNDSQALPYIRHSETEREN